MFKDRVFNFAILLSVICHIFWLSVITVVITPKETKPIRFSKVSFLGPILERGALEVRIKPRERSFLEKRYLSDIQKLSNRQAGSPVHQKSWHMEDVATGRSSDERLLALIEEAVNNPKIEPIYDKE